MISGRHQACQAENGNDFIAAACMVAYPHSPGVPAKLYWVIDTWESIQLLVYPHIHYWATYPRIITSFQTSRGKELKTISMLFYKRKYIPLKELILYN
jgi:hypothetical protein